MPRSKEARELIKKVRAAGGDVDDSGTGRMKVIGPDGTAMVGDNVTAGRAWKETVRKIERYTGLKLSDGPSA